MKDEFKWLSSPVQWVYIYIWQQRLTFRRVARAPLPLAMVNFNKGDSRECFFFYLICDGVFTAILFKFIASDAELLVSDTCFFVLTILIVSATGLSYLKNVQLTKH